jgi:hypothetical protein
VRTAPMFSQTEIELSGRVTSLSGLRLLLQRRSQRGRAPV